MLAVIFIAVFLLAAIFLIVGLRIRRIGDEPNCRTCKYNLTGIVSSNCPECGTALSPESIRWGLHKRRPIFVVIAVLLLAIEFPIFDGIRWVRYFPYSVLLEQAKLGSKSAVVELMLRSSSLTAAQAQELADYSLQMQRRVLDGIDVGTLPANHQDWQHLLVVLDNQNLLRTSQRTLYHQQYLGYFVNVLQKSPGVYTSKFLWIAPPNLPQEELHARLVASTTVASQNGPGRPIELDRLVKPREREQYDGVSWDMEFEIARSKWTTADRVRTGNTSSVCPECGTVFKVKGFDT